MSQVASAGRTAQSLLRDLGERAGYARDRWWIPLAAGLASAVLGLAVLAAGWTAGSLAVMAGVMFIIRGAFLALNPAYAARTSGEHVAVGIAAVLAGILLAVWPGPTPLVLAVFGGVWLVVSGGYQAVLSVAGRRELPYWRFTLALGVIELLLGLWVMRTATAASASTVIGVWAVVTGLMFCALAFEIRRAAAPR
jgi:uncharacterized membrane protein HdeD (DUF308 family)